MLDPFCNLTLGGSPSEIFSVRTWYGNLFPVSQLKVSILSFKISYIFFILLVEMRNVINIQKERHLNVTMFLLFLYALQTFF